MSSGLSADRRLLKGYLWSSADHGKGGHRPPTCLANRVGVRPGGFTLTITTDNDSIHKSEIKHIEKNREPKENRIYFFKRSNLITNGTSVTTLLRQHPVFLARGRNSSLSIFKNKIKMRNNLSYHGDTAQVSRKLEIQIGNHIQACPRHEDENTNNRYKLTQRLISQEGGSRPQRRRQALSGKRMLASPSFWSLFWGSSWSKDKSFLTFLLKSLPLSLVFFLISPFTFSKSPC